MAENEDPGLLPFVSIAVFWENVLKQDDGVNSLIRITDQVNIPVPSQATPVEGQVTVQVVPYPIFNVKFFLRIVGVAECGRRTITLSMLRADGIESARKEFDVEFTEENFVHTSTIDIQIANTAREGMLQLNVFA